MLKLEDFLPASPKEGPPLPRLLKLRWGAGTPQPNTELGLLDVRVVGLGDFYQGSLHTVSITLRNTGVAVATISQMRIDFQAYRSGAWSYTGATPWSPYISISPATISPGESKTYSGQFTIPRNAELDQYRYWLQVWYDGKKLDWSSVNAPNAAYAFTVVKAEALLEATSVSFVS